MNHLVVALCRVSRGKEKQGWIRHVLKTPCRHLQHPDLVARPEAVLDTPQKPRAARATHEQYEIQAIIAITAITAIYHRRFTELG